MATPRKPWPHECDWARMDSITLARDGRQGLVSELERIQDVSLMRSVTKAIEAFREIEEKLKSCKSDEE